MNTENHFKTLARCAPASWMAQFRKAMKAGGYRVVNDSAAGTCVCYNEDTVVARGMKMGAMGWLVRADPAAVAAQ